MGAEVFMASAFGKDINEAFRNAVSNAQHESGHGGYSGTIAEKARFVFIDYDKERQEGESKRDFIYRLIEQDDERISDKWGPAGCIVGKTDGHFIFFGWASS